MITVSYEDESHRMISIELKDWEAVELYASDLLNAPIDVEYLEYYDGERVGLLNLNNFLRC